MTDRLINVKLEVYGTLSTMILNEKLSVYVCMYIILMFYLEIYYYSFLNMDKVVAVMLGVLTIL